MSLSGLGWHLAEVWSTQLKPVLYQRYFQNNSRSTQMVPRYFYPSWEGIRWTDSLKRIKDPRVSGLTFLAVARELNSEILWILQFRFQSLRQIWRGSVLFSFSGRHCHACPLFHALIHSRSLSLLWIRPVAVFANTLKSLTASFLCRWILRSVVCI